MFKEFSLKKIEQCFLEGEIPTLSFILRFFRVRIKIVKHDYKPTGKNNFMNISV